MEFTKDELIKWNNNKNEGIFVNPRTNAKIKQNGPTYKKLEKEYNILLNNENNKSNKIYINELTYIENKIVIYLNLKDTKKIKIYKYKILDIYEKSEGCSCQQNIEININKNEEIKEDIINILEIIKKEYNNEEIKKKYRLDYNCNIEELDENGNVYGFIFNTKDDNIEYPIIPVHCYSYKKNKLINICIHIQYISFYNHHNNVSHDYETHLLIVY